MTKRRGWRWLLCAALVGVGAFALGADSKTAKERTLAKLMDEGQSALADQQYKAARDDFCDVLTVDPRNQLALDGAMLAYLDLNDYDHAKAELERSLGLFSRISRPTAINGAAVLVHGKNPMRAARNLMAYMAPLSKVDEAALNALAIALWSADDQARKGHLFGEAVTVYTADNKKLEATRPGMKRWGIQWVDTDEAAKKNATWMAAQKSTVDISRSIAALQSQLESMQNSDGYGRSASTAAMNRIQSQINSKQEQYDKAMKGAERPPIPASVPLVGLTADDSDALASAADPARSSEPSPAPAAEPTDSSPAPTPSTPATPDSAVAGAPSSSADTTPKVTRTHHITSYAAAFPVGRDLLVTTAEAVDGASDLQVEVADGTPFPATLVRSDPDSGLALLRTPTTKFAYLSLADAFPGGSIVCVSFPSVDLFQPIATQITGSASAPKASWRVRLAQAPRLGGGPLLAGGRVVGVELAGRDSEITEIPAVTLDELKKFVGSDAAPDGGVADGVAVTVQLSATRQQ